MKGCMKIQLTIQEDMMRFIQSSCHYKSEEQMVKGDRQQLELRLHPITMLFNLII